MEIDMQALKVGNDEAFEKIYNSTCKLVYSICLSYMKDKFLAEDMMQETYLKVYSSIHQYQNNTSPNSWIVTIAKNLCINELKKRKRYVNIDMEMMDDLTDEQSNQDTPLLDIAFKILKEKELTIVLLHIIDQRKLVDIAKLLNTSEGTIRWRYNNALNKIRKYVERSKMNE